MKQKLNIDMKIHLYPNLSCKNNSIYFHQCSFLYHIPCFQAEIPEKIIDCRRTDQFVFVNELCVIDSYTNSIELVIYS